jgi:propanol-preferring alcohol dehydrogenase
MKAMVLTRLGPLSERRDPLELAHRPEPTPGPGQIVMRVSVCGVCHTELDEIEGRLPPARLPMIPGHQAVGRVAGLGAGVRQFQIGERAGVAWINSACGTCAYCRSGQENLCADFRATGRDADGGYAEYLTVSADFAHPIPATFADAEAAPLLCAGAIGYRSLRLANLRDGQPLGLTGFGASAHLVLKMARRRYPNSPVFVFARSPAERDFALSLGAAWAGETEAEPPAPLAALIDTTPAWRPVLAGLRRLTPGGRLVINAIRKEDADRAQWLQLNYAEQLWLEKEIKSVANVTRADVREFLELAAQIPIRPEYQEYALEDANRALLELKEHHVRGAKVLRVTDA